MDSIGYLKPPSHSSFFVQEENELIFQSERDFPTNGCSTLGRANGGVPNPEDAVDHSDDPNDSSLLASIATASSSERLLRETHEVLQGLVLCQGF